MVNGEAEKFQEILFVEKVCDRTKLKVINLEKSFAQIQHLPFTIYRF